MEAMIERLLGLFPKSTSDLKKHIFIVLLFLASTIFQGVLGNSVHELIRPYLFPIFIIASMIGVGLLAIAIFSVIRAQRSKNTSQSQQSSVTIKIIETSKKHRTLVTIAITIACGLASVLLVIFNPISNSQTVTLVPLSLAIFVVLSHVVFLFRVRRGLYGTNEIEAREILSAIMNAAKERHLSKMVEDMRSK